MPKIWVRKSNKNNDKNTPIYCNDHTWSILYLSLSLRLFILIQIVTVARTSPEDIGTSMKNTSTATSELVVATTALVATLDDNKILQKAILGALKNVTTDVKSMMQVSRINDLIQSLFCPSNSLLNLPSFFIFLSSY